MESKGFAAIFPVVIRGQFRAVFLLFFAAVLPACKENLSPRRTGLIGPDTSAPSVRLFPASDTLVDSVGVLAVHVQVGDPSIIKHLEFIITPPTFSFAPLVPGDTAFDAFFPIPLALFKHSSFTFSVVAIDGLDHQAATPPVTVTVR